MLFMFKETVTDINNLITNYSFIASVEFANKSLNLNGKSKGKK